MKLTTRGRYAVTAMLDLALHQDEGPVPLCAIARRNNISGAYLEQLLADLRRDGLITGVRGPGGGYRLARPQSQITMAEIMAAVAEDLDATGCGGDCDCTGMTHDLWAGLTEQVQCFLEGVTLAALRRDCAAAQTVPAQGTSQDSRAA